MKIYEIWEIIRNEPRDIQRMVLSSLDGQLNVRFEQVVDWEINKLCIVDEEIPGGFVGYHDVIFLCDESWLDLGFDKDPNLPLYREMILAVDKLRAVTDDIYGNPDDCIDIEVVFRGNSPSEAAKDLLGNIRDKIYESEFIDITDTSLSNLKNGRKLFLIRFPSV